MMTHRERRALDEETILMLRDTSSPEALQHADDEACRGTPVYPPRTTRLVWEKAVCASADCFVQFRPRGRLDRHRYCSRGCWSREYYRRHAGATGYWGSVYGPRRRAAVLGAVAARREVA